MNKDAIAELIPKKAPGTRIEKAPAELMDPTDEIFVLLEQARSGDSAAYERLFACCRDALCGRMRRVIGGCSAEVASALAGQIWEKDKTLILRAPEEGGYTTEKGLFHRWVLRDGTTWRGIRSEDDGSPKLEQAWPRTEIDGLLDLPDPNAIDAGTVIEKCHRFALLLELIFIPQTGYPHQQLCFVLAKYVHGHVTPRGIDACATLVVEKYGNYKLRTMAQVVLAACQALEFPGSPFSGEEPACFAQLFQRMDLSVAELMGGERASFPQFEQSQDRRVAETRLSDYFSSAEADRASAVSVWCNRVAGRIRQLLGPCWRLDEERFWSKVEALAKRGKK